MRLLMWVYAQYPDSRCRVYQQYSVNERLLLTKAWKKCLDKQAVSCEHIVEFESEDNKNGSPLVVRVDLNNMVQSTNATNFARQRCTVRIEEMCEEVPWGETTLMRAYSQRADMRCSVYVPYNEQQFGALSNAWKKWPMKEDGSGEHIVEFGANDKNTGHSLVARVDLNKMVQTTSAANFAAPRCVVRIQNMCPSL